MTMEIFINHVYFPRLLDFVVHKRFKQAMFADTAPMISGNLSNIFFFLTTGVHLCVHLFCVESVSDTCMLWGLQE